MGRGPNRGPGLFLSRTLAAISPEVLYLPVYLIEHRLEPRLPQYLGYAAGDAGNNLAFMMTSMFLLLYYTDVVGISAAAVGTLFLLVRVWDAFADIVAGRMVDKTMTRWGKVRPFILFGSLPLLLLSVAVFSVPGGLSDGGKLIYAYVSHALLGLVYSLVNIPYGSLATAMTQRPEERARLATFRVFGSNLTILMRALVVALQVEGSDNLQRSLTITTLAFVVVGAALYLFTFFSAKEQVERDVPKVSLRETVTTLRQNRPLVMLCLSSLMFLTGRRGDRRTGRRKSGRVRGRGDKRLVGLVPHGRPRRLGCPEVADLFIGFVLLHEDVRVREIGHARC